MATLRALPSISSLLNHPPKNFASRANPNLRLCKHVKISYVRRNVRQIQGLGNEERVCENFAGEGQVSEIFTDDARVSEIFADEVQVSESFVDEVRVSGFLENIQGLGDERRISERFANEERFVKFFGAGFLVKSVNEARISSSFTHEARIFKRFAHEERFGEFLGAGIPEKFVRKNVRQILGLVKERFPDEARISSSFAGLLERFVRENARELAICTLVFALVCLPEERALANGGGPVMEEFWDNVRRYGFYFFTVVSGALYSLAKPLVDLLRDPSTQVLVLVVLLGTFYLLYLTVSTMLGLNEFQYEYAQ